MSLTDHDLKAELARFKEAYQSGDAELEARYRLDTDLPSNDFNREIVPPGNEIYADGCVRIMCDHDFWEVAILPYAFVDLSCGDIVATLWPELDAPIIRPDSGDHWWTAIGDDQMEVPGQPFELWVVISRTGQPDETVRLEVCNTKEQALDKGRKLKVSLDTESSAVWMVRTWSGGTRSDGVGHPLVSNVRRTTPLAGE